MDDTCNEPNHCRGVQNIILSCVATVIACTWIAIHPNISSLTAINNQRMNLLERIFYTARTIIFKRMPIFILAVIFPEFILAWAIRQHIVARDFAQRTGSTITHGFFIIMGGFHVCDDSGNSCYPLFREDLLTLVRRYKVEMPTEDEVKDKSKNGGLLYMLVSFQILWFIVQCIARGVKSMTLTKLEIVTLAYIAMNLWIYLAWWDKPRNVDRPILVPQKTIGTLRPTDKSPEEDADFMARWLGRIFGWQDDCICLSRSKITPMFYSGKPTDDQMFISSGIGILLGNVFAAIHCIAWSFVSPTLTQLVLWRLCSLAILGIVLFLLGAFLSAAVNEKALEMLNDCPGRTFFQVLLLGWVLVYMISRMGSLVLAFMELRAPPPGVHQTVYWTNFIPHA